MTIQKWQKNYLRKRKEYILHYLSKNWDYDNLYSIKNRKIFSNLNIILQEKKIINKFSKLEKEILNSIFSLKDCSFEESNYESPCFYLKINYFFQKWININFDNFSKFLYVDFEKNGYSKPRPFSFIFPVNGNAIDKKNVYKKIKTQFNYAFNLKKIPQYKMKQLWEFIDNFYDNEALKPEIYKYKELKFLRNYEEEHSSYYTMTFIKDNWFIWIDNFLHKIHRINIEIENKDNLYNNFVYKNLININFPFIQEKLEFSIKNIIKISKEIEKKWVWRIKQGLIIDNKNFNSKVFNLIDSIDDNEIIRLILLSGSIKSKIKFFFLDKKTYNFHFLKTYLIFLIINDFDNYDKDKIKIQLETFYEIFKPVKYNINLAIKNYIEIYFLNLLKWI